MRVFPKLLAGGAAAAALASAAPATAQYYPGYPGYPGYGYGGPGYGQQAAVNQCAAAVQQRLSGGYGGYGYGYGGGYGRGRVLGISRVEPRSEGGFNVRGVASSGRYDGYGYGYNGEPRVDLTWRCKTDYRGFIVGLDVNPAQRNYGGYGYGYGGPGYGYGQQPYTPYDNDYSQYGYSRY